MSGDQPLYTTPEAAEILGTSSSNLRNMIRKGTAQPAKMLGHNWLFTQEEIERLRNRKTKPGPAKKNA